MAKVLGKEYDFRVMNKGEFLEEFTTRYMWEREKIINGEQQFYIDPVQVPDHDPFVLSDKGLSIVAKVTPIELATYAVGLNDVALEIGLGKLTPDQFKAYTTPQPFVSGAITSRDKGYSQLFGYFEISAKLPRAKGAWPAFWLYPTFKSWPSGIAVLNEIDVMEATNSVLNGVYHGTLHTNESGVMVHSTGNDVNTKADLVNEYHRYAVSWEPDYIIWYFDDKEVIRRKTPQDMLTEPRHFLLNLAVGGKWSNVGIPDPGDYPASLDVEWVRIYKSEYEPPESVKKVEESPSSGTTVENAAKALELTAAYLREISRLL